jgi:hypothetical protein
MLSESIDVETSFIDQFSNFKTFFSFDVLYSGKVS